jgi:hypothetical protein
MAARAASPETPRARRPQPPAPSQVPIREEGPNGYLSHITQTVARQVRPTPGYGCGRR